ncbi:MAG: hypothetical protein AUG08_04620 [Acidobacteria bacterium 13_1_20CM_2_55_15]|nr:MAG: hypothetical protein AUG08_04620 [Acidobacteria bacterium 13_1_20CM_2_55_15]
MELTIRSYQHSRNGATGNVVDGWLEPFHHAGRWIEISKRDGEPLRVAPRSNDQHRAADDLSFRFKMSRNIGDEVVCPIRAAGRAVENRQRIG